MAFSSGHRTLYLVCHTPPSIGKSIAWPERTFHYGRKTQNSLSIPLLRRLDEKVSFALAKAAWIGLHYTSKFCNLDVKHQKQILEHTNTLFNAFMDSGDEMVGTTGFIRENRVTLRQLFGNCHSLSFLLCRTISPIVVEDEGTIIVTVTDPEGTSKTNVSIKNYSTSILKKGKGNVEDILPIGTYLAMKYPKKTLLWDNPSEVQFLSGKDVKSIMGEDFKWVRLQDHHDDDPYTFWNDETGLMFNTLREYGNKLFASNCLSDALRFYDLGLQYDPSEMEKSITLSNKAFTLLRLGCNQGALKVARHALELNGRNNVAIYRLGQAFLALGDSDQAIQVLRNSIAILPPLKDRDALEHLLKKAINRKKAPATSSPEVYIALNDIFTTKMRSRGPMEEVEFSNPELGVSKPLTVNTKEYVHS